jgi:hypothetical protein
VKKQLPPYFFHFFILSLFLILSFFHFFIFCCIFALKYLHMRKQSMNQDTPWRSLLIKSILVVASVAIIVWLLPRESQNNFKVELGKPWKYAEFTAPFDFPIYKTREVIQAERDSIQQAFEPYYNYDKNVEGTQIRQFVKDYNDGIPGLSADYISILANRLHRLYQQGIMNTSEYKNLSRDTTKHIRLVSGKNATALPITHFVSTVGAYEQLFLDPALSEHKELLQKCSLNDYIQPNLLYDKERNEASLSDQLNSMPLATGLAQHGQKIIDRGDIVDQKAYNILESFFRENERRQQDTTQLSTVILGQLVYVAILILLFTIYLTLYRAEYFEKPRNTTMLYSLIVLFSVMTSLMVDHNILHVYIIPYAMVPIFIRVFIDASTAIMTHLVMVLICACMLQHPLEFIAVQLCAGLAAVYTLRELSSRSQLFRTAIVATVVAVLVDLSMAWIREDDFTSLDYSDYNYLLVNGLLLFCSYPLLYLIEKAFGFTSGITLIELSDMNKEPLRLMSEVAPGTFQHSIQVGNLAAEIARKIGANAQLVRTGALYHDIGKTVNPAYFTENQTGVNPHEMLTYVDSARLIISHVTEGIKLAEKHNLPDVIRQFIATHHGQGKAKYFYVKQKNEHPDEPVDDLLFTYPGPNPFTREQAILMMADTVEAASRSLPDYSERTIRELVDRLVDAQTAEGYFRDCPITFRDIQYAKTVLIEKLKTIYHTRITYPELKK